MSFTESITQTSGGLGRSVLGYCDNPEQRPILIRVRRAIGWMGVVGTIPLLLFTLGSLCLRSVEVFGAGLSRVDGEWNREVPAPAWNRANLDGLTVGTKMVTETAINGRLGFNVTYLSANQFGCGKISDYTDILSLKVGIYLDYTLCRQPERPNGMEFVQMINIHQTLTCPLYSPSAWDREACPYAEPHGYTLHVSHEEIIAVAQANPGALWLIGNEVDRRDWPIWDYSVDPPQIVGTSGQNEMLPELYAQAYHELYHLLKNADPTAQVANAGLIQATPLRLRYLSIVWDTYQQLYGESMPVDVWNVHNFILREVRGEYGADFPPGLTGTLDDGQYWQQNDRDTHVNLSIFDQQIRAMRQWMKERNQQDKPLIVTEYGVLYEHEGMGVPSLVQGFMQDTFDYFLNTKDCALGYAADDCRLVQRWLWFSLEVQKNGLNPQGGLFSSDTLTITQTGTIFRDFSERHTDELAWPPPVKEIRYLHLPVIRLE